MDANTLRKFKWFWAWEDEKEEAWLRNMSLEGWHLASVGFPAWYTFQQGAPVSYAYRLDYIPQKRKNDDYYQLFRDAGWKYLGELNNWQYFRKEVTGSELPEIYTDVESKVQKYRLVLGMLLPFFPISIIFWVNIDRLPASGIIDFFVLLFLAIYLTLMYGILRLTQRIDQLKKRL